MNTRIRNPGGRQKTSQRGLNIQMCTERHKRRTQTLICMENSSCTILKKRRTNFWSPRLKIKSKKSGIPKMSPSKTAEIRYLSVFQKCFMDL